MKSYLSYLPYLIVLLLALAALAFTPSKIQNCRADCGDGSCTVSCPQGTNANCKCTRVSVNSTGVLNLPSCDCYGVGGRTAGNVQRNHVMMSVSPAQIANIEAFKRIILRDGKPAGLTKRLALQLDIMAMAMQRDRVDIYLLTTNRFLKDFELMEVTTP